MNHLIDSKQLSREFLDKLFSLTKKIEENPKNFQDSLKGKIVATLFFEPSTRTRLSFESAVLRLGGSIIGTENAVEMASVKKGESLEDTIRTVQNYVDAIVMRHFDDDAAKIAASVADVPIINAGSGKKHHPTQALLDLYTILKEKGSIDDTSIVLIGDLLYGRTIHSLIELLSLYKNITIYGLAMETFELPKEYIDLIEKSGNRYIKCNDFHNVPKHVDFIYQTRTQKERFQAEFEIKEHIINKKVLDQFSNDTKLLHPLPRNEEINTDVDNDPRSIYFKQAKNGMFVRMAILYTLLT